VEGVSDTVSERSGLEERAEAVGMNGDSSDRWSAAIAYLFILCWIPYFLRGQQPFPLFHAKQGILLFLLEICCGILLWILEVTIGRIPFLGLVMLIVARLAIYLPILGLVVLGFTRAISGEKLPLPWIGSFEVNIPDPPRMGSVGGASKQ
jgi:uncharacterized membrane protein